MAPARAAAYVGGAILLAAWLAAADSTPPEVQVPRAPAPRPEALELDALARDVQAQAARLRTRLAAAPAATPATRNPFAFGSRTAPPHRELAATPPPLPAPAPVAAAAPLLPLELVGIAEQADNGVTTRTAVVAGSGDQLFMVTEGQPLTDRYRVGVVGADAVELTDLATGATRRLGLR